MSLSTSAVKSERKFRLLILMRAVLIQIINNFAISSEGIGVALQKSASSLAAANNSIEESIALATAMNSVLQNPEVVGTALKTVFR